jgi:two-component system, NtrC family, nitrogen regulation sensor histidine kinase NtrY
MKLRTKYLAFVIILHLVTLVLSYFIFTDNKVLFIASEFLILVSAVISWQLYNELIEPLKTLMRGVEAIRDRDFNVKFLETGKYEMDQLIGVYNEMIDQLRDERTKQQAQHFFLEKLIHTSPTGILVLDFDENIQQLNPKARSILNLPEQGTDLNLASEMQSPLMQEIKKLETGTSKMVTANGVNTYKLQKSHFIDRGFPRYFVMIEEMTAEILAAEKKAYGKVIRMMAHEVNNTIGPVNSIIQSALKATWPNGSNENIKQALQVAADRNHNLNLFMRNFAEVVRLPEPNRKKINLNELLLRTGKLMEMRADEKQVRFEYELTKQPCYIYADEQQMEQAIINILKNGMEAIEERGVVRIACTEKQLVISDNGKGIDEEKAAQLFSPFFSSKKDGQGIGLTLVKEILLNHGFPFSLKTVAPGKTEFVITFSPNT